MSDRAKQFQPFDALKGYKEELRKRERVVVEKKELTADEIDELNNIIYKIKKNMMVKVIYFDNGEYVEKTGIVSKIDFDNRIIKIVDCLIDFNNLSSINILENNNL